ncbi:MAG: TIGR03564 family F420-dependent LLM class oxidoreductase [Chloroflexi bacterium]|nr:TIGR03564 family F420-dependent LLM class oxidoreductase [Chloroflexota bacterium]MDA1228586.1 TIGR03564 family F420-dependent LLM class oxidoreductase [Chloroflexota bacterium]
MRIGIFVGAAPTDDVRQDAVVQQAKDAEAAGFDSFWTPHISSRGSDALTTLALIGSQTSRIALGSGVVPTYPRHPTAMAQQAMTTQIAASGRFTLGIGPSHKPGIEDVLGLSYDRPAKHVREYLSVLRPLMDEGRVDFDGEFFKVHADLSIADRLPCSVIISALAPRMLQLAGEMADGTITWMAGAEAIENHVVPRITGAAAIAGRPAPAVVVGLPVAVTDDESAGRAQAANLFERYGSLVNYRRILDVQGAEGPSEVAVVGSEAEVERQLRAFADAGATEFVASVFPVGEDNGKSTKRTNALLQSLVGNI